MSIRTSFPSLLLSMIMGAGSGLGACWIADHYPIPGFNSSPSSGVVGFDTARLANAQRQHLGLSGEFDEDQLTLLTHRAREVLEEKAQGRPVIVSRALVLDGQVEDLTDEVLEHMGLPTDTPGRGHDIPDPDSREMEHLETRFRDSSIYDQLDRAFPEEGKENEEGSENLEDLLP